jgi:hypothetical protein
MVKKEALKAKDKKEPLTIHLFQDLPKCPKLESMEKQVAST